MKAHARRTNSETPIVAEGLTCGFCDSSTVFPTGASRAIHYRKCQAYQRAKDGQRTSASSNDSRSPSATPLLQPHQPLSPRQSTGGPAAHAVGIPLPLGIGNATVWDCPSPHDGSFRTECSPLLYGRPSRYSLVIVTAYSKKNITSGFVMNIGCTSRGPTIHVVCGDYSFLLLVLLCFCVAACAASPLVCVHPP
ncbi:hypothetical protein TCDM_12550 [Trypanosoma cruzi Dm28c]|uniref:Uncharacterized protein n=1 Tax=Trypanosoma cruzi Dm28c TaxID=1416333 RepID=V5CKP2_TRYCR|nr:hypothetical protein TCDM_12550 [Trypanosoma cruzi Dm28c]